MSTFNSFSCDFESEASPLATRADFCDNVASIQCYRIYHPEMFKVLSEKDVSKAIDGTGIPHLVKSLSEADIPGAINELKNSIKSVADDANSIRSSFVSTSTSVDQFVAKADFTVATLFRNVSASVLEVLSLIVNAVIFAWNEVSWSAIIPAIALQVAVYVLKYVPEATFDQAYNHVTSVFNSTPAAAQLHEQPGNVFVTEAPPISDFSQVASVIVACCGAFLFPLKFDGKHLSFVSDCIKGYSGWANFSRHVVPGFGSLFELVAGLVPKTVQLLMVEYLPHSLLPESLFATSPVMSWVKEVQVELAPQRKSNASRTPTTFMKRYVDLQKRGFSFYNDLKDLRQSKLELDVVTHTLTKVNDLIAQVMSIGIGSKFSPAPFCIYLVGSPGVGKSTLASLLAAELVTRNIMGATPTNLVYRHRSGSKFFDGYTRQPVLLFDDFGQVTTTEGNESDVSVLMQFKSPTSTPLNQARLDDKGMTASFELIIACSNVAFPDAPEISSYDAFLRRRDVVLHVELNPDAKENGLSEDRYLFTELSRGNHRGQESNVPKYSGDDCVTPTQRAPFSEMILRLRERANAYHLKESKVIEGMTLAVASKISSRIAQSINDPECPINEVSRAYALATKEFGFQDLVDGVARNARSAEGVMAYVEALMAGDSDYQPEMQAAGVSSDDEYSDSRPSCSHNLAFVSDKYIEEVVKPGYVQAYTVALRLNGDVRIGEDLQDYHLSQIYIDRDYSIYQPTADEKLYVVRGLPYTQRAFKLVDGVHIPCTDDTVFPTFVDEVRAKVLRDRKRIEEQSLRRSPILRQIWKATKGLLALAGVLGFGVFVAKAAAYGAYSLFTWAKSKFFKTSHADYVRHFIRGECPYASAEFGANGDYEGPRCQICDKVFGEFHTEAKHSSYPGGGAGGRNRSLLSVRKGAKFSKLSKHVQFKTEAAGAEPAVAQLMTKVRSNTVHFEVVPDESTGVVAYGVGGLFVDGTCVLIPSHILVWDTTPSGDFVPIPAGTNIRLTCADGTAYTFPFDMDCVVVDVERDLAVYNVAPHVAPRKSLMKLFLQEGRAVQSVLKEAWVFQLQYTNYGKFKVWSPCLERPQNVRRVDDPTTEPLMDRVRFKGINQSADGAPVYRDAIGWKYDSATMSCGAVLFANVVGQGFVILGFHVAGVSSKATIRTRVAQPIDAGLIRGYVRAFDGMRFDLEEEEFDILECEMSKKPETPRFDPGPDVHETGRMRVIGYAPTNKQPTMNGKTDIRKSLFHDRFRERCGKQPAVLWKGDSRLKDKTFTPTENAVRKKYMKVLKPIPQFVIDAAVGLVVDHFRSLETPDAEKWKILSDHEVLNGNEFGLNSPDYSKSPGYPHVLTRPKGVRGQAYLLKFEDNVGGEQNRIYSFDDNSRVGKDFHALYEHHCDTLEKSIKRPIIWIAGLKDELRSNSKVEKGETRQIESPPLEHKLAWRKYYGCYEAFLNRHPIDSCTAIGLDAESLHWNDLFSRLLDIGGRGFACDVSNWDGSLSPQLIHADASLRITLMQEMGAQMDGKWLNACDTLHNHVAHTFLLEEDTIIEINGAMKSGNPATLSMNCGMHLIVVAATWFMHAPKNIRNSAGAMFSNVGVCVMGDDIVCSVSEEASKFFDANAYQRTGAMFGLKITGADKSDVVETQDVLDLSFLKRDVGKFPFGMKGKGIFWPKIAKETIYSQLAYIRTDPRNEIQLLQNVNTALRFAAGWGAVFFDSIRSEIFEELTRQGFTHLNGKIMTVSDAFAWMCEAGDIEESVYHRVFRTFKTEMMSSALANFSDEEGWEDADSEEEVTGGSNITKPLALLPPPPIPSLPPPEATAITTKDVQKHEVVASSGPSVITGLNAEPAAQEMLPTIASEPLPTKIADRRIENERFRQKQQLIKTFVWDTSKKMFDVIGTFTAPWDFIKDCSISNIIAQGTYARFSVSVLVRCTQNPFAQGCFFVIYMPQETKESALQLLEANPASNMSVYKPTMVYPNREDMSSVSMVIPWTFFEPFMRSSLGSRTDLDYLGTLAIVAYNPLRTQKGTSPATTISVYATISVDARVITQSLCPNVYVYDHNWEDEVKMRNRFYKTEGGASSKSGDQTSSQANTDASKTSMPIQINGSGNTITLGGSNCQETSNQPRTSGASVQASAALDIPPTAAMLDNASDLKQPRPIYTRNSIYRNVDQFVPAKRLAYRHTAQALAYTPMMHLSSTYPGTPEECMKIPCVHTNFSVDTTMPEGKLLAAWPVMMGEALTMSTVKPGVTIRGLSPLETWCIGSQLSAYRVDHTYHFEAVKTDMHNLVLLVCYVEGEQDPRSMTMQDAMVQNQISMDFRRPGKTSYNVDVPFSSMYPFWQFPNGPIPAGQWNKYYSGWILVFNQTRMSAPPTVSEVIDINVFKAYGKFSGANHGSINSSLRLLSPQDSNKPTVQGEVFDGESAPSAVVESDPSVAQTAFLTYDKTVTDFLSEWDAHISQITSGSYDEVLSRLEDSSKRIGDDQYTIGSIVTDNLSRIYNKMDSLKSIQQAVVDELKSVVSGSEGIRDYLEKVVFPQIQITSVNTQACYTSSKAIEGKLDNIAEKLDTIIGQMGGNENIDKILANTIKISEDLETVEGNTVALSQDIATVQTHLETVEGNTVALSQDLATAQSYITHINVQVTNALPGAVDDNKLYLQEIIKDTRSIKTTVESTHGVVNDLGTSLEHVEREVDDHSRNVNSILGYNPDGYACEKFVKDMFYRQTSNHGNIRIASFSVGDANYYRDFESAPPTNNARDLREFECEMAMSTTITPTVGQMSKGDKKKGKRIELRDIFGERDIDVIALLRIPAPYAIYTKSDIHGDFASADWAKAGQMTRFLLIPASPPINPVNPGPNNAGGFSRDIGAWSFGRFFANYAGDMRMIVDLREAQGDPMKVQVAYISNTQAWRINVDAKNGVLRPTFGNSAPGDALGGTGPACAKTILGGVLSGLNVVWQSLELGENVIEFGKGSRWYGTRWIPGVATNGLNGPWQVDRGDLVGMGFVIFAVTAPVVKTTPTDSKSSIQISIKAGDSFTFGRMRCIPAVFVAGIATVANPTKVYPYSPDTYAYSDVSAVTVEKKNENPYAEIVDATGRAGVINWEREKGSHRLNIINHFLERAHETDKSKASRFVRDSEFNGNRVIGRPIVEYQCEMTASAPTIVLEQYEHITPYITEPMRFFESGVVKADYVLLGLFPFITLWESINRAIPNHRGKGNFTWMSRHLRANWEAGVVNFGRSPKAVETILWKMGFVYTGSEFVMYCIDHPEYLENDARRGPFYSGDFRKAIGEFNDEKIKIDRVQRQMAVVENAEETRSIDSSEEELGVATINYRERYIDESLKILEGMGIRYDRQHPWITMLDQFARGKLKRNVFPELWLKTYRSDPISGYKLHPGNGFAAKMPDGTAIKGESSLLKNEDSKNEAMLRFVTKWNVWLEGDIEEPDSAKEEEDDRSDLVQDAIRDIDDSFGIKIDKITGRDPVALATALAQTTKNLAELQHRFKNACHILLKAKTGERVVEGLKDNGDWWLKSSAFEHCVSLAEAKSYAERAEVRDAFYPLLVLGIQMLQYIWNWTGTV